MVDSCEYGHETSGCIKGRELDLKQEKKDVTVTIYNFENNIVQILV